MRVVIALGDNALLRRGEPVDAAVQRANVKVAAEAIAAVARDHQVVLTHGNGPQVGLLALQNAAYEPVAPYHGSCGLGLTSTVEVDGPDPLGPLTGSDAFEVNMQPNPGSPLIDAIPPGTPYSGPQVTCSTFPDQRGLARPQEGDGVEPAW